MANRKTRKKQKLAYENDASHSAVISSVVTVFLIVGCWSWGVAKFIVEPFSTFLIVPAWVIAVASIAIIFIWYDQRSSELVDRHGLRCPKCGGSTVKSGGRRGPNDPAYGITKCFSCDAKLD